MTPQPSTPPSPVHGDGEVVEQDLSVDSDGPVLARELAEVCRLVACGRRESDLHPLEASLACVRVLARARERVGVRLPGDE